MGSSTNTKKKKGGIDSDRLKEIEAIIAELEKTRQAEEEREKRVFQNVAKAYAQREKVGIGKPLGSLLEKAKLTVKDLDEFYTSEEREAQRTIKEFTPQLQLAKNEIELIGRKIRAVALINPCSAFHSSPGWICQTVATSCGSSQLKSGNASASCVCSPPASMNNRCDPQVQATGTGSKGYSSAELNVYWYFNIPARNNPQTIFADIWIDLHGFYILRPSAGMAGPNFNMDLMIEGFQYGWSWASASKSVLSLSGNLTGRIDKDMHLSFNMPIGGGDPFQVRVSAKLKANAHAGGSLVIGDFASLEGNYINVIWVNTYGPLD